MNALLLIGHPGHELRLFEWVRQARPQVVMLTQGDGSLRRARLDDSRQVLHGLGLPQPAAWIEPVPDAAVYQALLGQATSPLPRWLDQLDEAAWQTGIDTVVADEAEGYNPTHDLCRVLANQLVARLRHRGREVLNLEVPLVGHPCDPARQAQVAQEVRLDDAQLAHKLESMQDYARRTSPVLAQEVQTMLDTFGHAAFARECLYPARRTAYEDRRLPSSMPYFEQVGELRQRQGVYPHVIRARHLRDLVGELHLDTGA